MCANKGVIGQVLVTLGCLLIQTDTFAAQALGKRPAAKPATETSGTEAIVTELIRAFDRADIVALGEAHRRKQDSDLRIALIRHPEFARRVQSIVVEFGNARYQPILDSYIRGGDVKPEQLQLLWRDTTQPQVWDSPLYEEFFRTVREVNQKLPPLRKLRVLAGDPPIDWRIVNNKTAAESFLRQRDTYPASILREQVLAKRKKALVVYGMGHVLRNGGLTRELESTHPGRVYVVLVVGASSPASQDLEGKVKSSSRPVLLRLLGTPFGDVSAGRLPSAGEKKITKGLQGRSPLQALKELLGFGPEPPPVHRGAEPAREEKALFRDWADACVYLGAAPESESWIKPDPNIYKTTSYQTELERRQKILHADALQ